MTGVVTKDIRTQAVEERASAAVLDVQLKQVGQGAFQTRTQTAEFDNAMIYRDRWNRLTACRGALSGDYVLFAAPVATESTVDWCGCNVWSHRLAVGLPGKQVDFIMPADTLYVAMVLPTPYLRTTFGDSAVDKLLKSGVQHIQVEPDLGRRFLNRIDRVTKAAAISPGSFHQNAVKAIEADFLDDIAELGIFLGDQATVRQAALRDILRKACNAAELLRERITVPEFAAQIDVGQRNLELAFKRYLGITPRRYLNCCRMQQVHRDLRSRPAASHCVTEVVGSWGFNELGRFSGEYRKLFGELPSATLKRPPLRAANRLFDLEKGKIGTDRDYE
ncbi:MAG: helix-turn-helix domain-containing protein [Halieaceae bacterium]